MSSLRRIIALFSLLRLKSRALAFITSAKGRNGDWGYSFAKEFTSANNSWSSPAF